MSDVFNEYANYYDLIYADKDYVKEVNYVLDLIRMQNKNAHSLLDIGCGTGKHAMFICENGMNVTGIDISEQMINIANSKNNTSSRFIHEDISEISFNNKFDVATALFHVINYQNTKEKLEMFLNGINRNLNDNGLFIFDFWNASGVLSDPPTCRRKEFENEKLSVKRVSHPHHDKEKQTIDITFTIDIEDRLTNKSWQLNETHKMKYFFVNELTDILKRCGFNTLETHSWLKKNEITEYDWYGCIVAQKKE